MCIRVWNHYFFRGKCRRRRKGKQSKAKKKKDTLDACTVVVGMNGASCADFYPTRKTLRYTVDE